MKVVCVEKFEGVHAHRQEPVQKPMPQKDSIYTVIMHDHYEKAFFLKEFGMYRKFEDSKFRPITTEDFRWESIDEVLQNVTSEVEK